MDNVKTELPALPPAGLSEQSQALYRDLAPRFSTTQRVLLSAALSAKDRMEEAQQQIAMDGLLSKKIRGKRQTAHSLCRFESAARADFLRAWHQLGLDRPAKPKTILVGTGTASQKA